MNNNPVLEKSAGMHERGIAAVEKGEVKPFQMPANVNQRCNVSLLFEPVTSCDFDECVMNRLQSEAGKTGVSLFAAGRDYPLHATVGEALMADGSVAPEHFQC